MEVIFTMKKIGLGLAGITALLVLLLCAFVLWPLSEPPLVGQEGKWALESVNVVDVRSGEILADRTLWIDAGLIVDISAAGESTERTGFTTISGDGKYVIPGLWDMHTHSYKSSPQIHHPLYLAAGVTAARDMSGCMTNKESFWACPAERRRWTQEALNGSRVSPRYILQSSFQTNGGSEVPEGHPGFFQLQSDADAEALVAHYAESGVDFIKVYSELSREQFARVAKAAAAYGMQIAGHKPIKNTLGEAVAAGQRSIEHGRLFLFECFDGIESFRQHERPVRHYNAQLMSRMLSESDPLLCQALMQEMAQSNTWWVPTLTTLQMSARALDPTFTQDPRLNQIPYFVKKFMWFPDAKRARTKGFDDAGNFVHKPFFDRAATQVKAASDLGVKLLIGTDVSDTYVFAGSSVHDELRMFVDAGVSPLKALQAATLSAAEFSARDQLLGSIEVGKAADLVLINGNPLADIRNTRRIEAVMMAGVYYDKPALQQLREFAEAQASSIHLNVHFLWDALSSPSTRRQFAD